MTYIEIIKALGKDMDLIDLIDRQQEEIERLKIENQAFRSAANSYKLHYNEARTEAIKEFANKLKKHSRKMQSSDFSGDFWDRAVLVTDIDNLLKEMVGENNA